MSNTKYFLSFIEHMNKGAAFIAKKMDEFIYSDPGSSLVRARQFTEAVLRDVCEKEDVNIQVHKTIFEQINYLSQEADYEQEIINAFHQLRKIGNTASHDGTFIDLGEALKLHRIMYDIACWYYELYHTEEHNIPLYDTPKKQEIDIEKLVKEAIIQQIGTNQPIAKEKDEVIASSKITQTKINKYCLVQELSKLRESSREAVEGLAEFSKFKKYMHLERNVQAELFDILEKASQSQKSQLILVCGSVGDGKSHIISYFLNNYKDMMAEFQLHNDATESDEPDKTSMDTLNEKLDAFSDEKIATSKEKLIIAINLGTLNNFIDSPYGDRFQLLKKFVHDKKILEKGIEDNAFNEDENVQFVDFSDYNLFTLNEGKAESKFVKSIFDKITASKAENPFYESYQNNCLNCQNITKCPIKSNYEMLMDEQVQNAVIDLIVQCVVKDKIIISTRALLNFIYDLLVSKGLDINSPMFKDKIGKLQPINYLTALLPNLIFEQKELSFIFKSLHLRDPLNIRRRELDDFIIEFNNTIKVLNYFENYINYPKNYLTKLAPINFEEEMERRTLLKRNLLKLFIRSYYLCGKGELFNLKDEVYERYINYLYSWNKGEKSKLINMYNEIKEGIYNWNGGATKEQININLGKNQTDYKISEEMKIDPSLKNLPSQTKLTNLNKFLTELEVIYTAGVESFKVEVDYPLYELLVRVGQGYRPNKRDKNHFIQFVDFLAKIENCGSQGASLIFTQKNKKENKQYRLEYDENFEIYKFMEI